MPDDRITRRNFVRADAAAALAVSAGVIAPPAAPEQQTKATEMPYGTVGGVKMSRLILGSNPMGGGAHSRDLIYVGRLMKAYNTEERLLNLLGTAESQGITTILQGNTALVQRYNAQRGGHMRQIMSLHLPHNGDAEEEKIKVSIDGFMKQGAAALYVFGDTGDYLTRNGRVDAIGNALDVAKKMGAVLGVGGHDLEVVIQCEKQKLKPAFYVKTFHNDNYWSATPKQNRVPFCWYDDKGGNSLSGKTYDHNRFHDNIWCLNPEETIQVMSKVEVPWIAFKVLAAGAVHPKEGFGFAFQNGADFIAVGMLDYQVVENAGIAKSCVASHGNRARPWRA
jgi:hypothetical protein